MRGAQILTGGNQKENQQGSAVGNHNKEHQLAEYIRFSKKGIGMNSDEIHKPEQIGDEEQLAKGDAVINGQIHGIIGICRVMVLGDVKQNAEYRPEQQQRNILNDGFVLLLQSGETHGGLLFMGGGICGLPMGRL